MKPLSVRSLAIGVVKCSGYILLNFQGLSSHLNIAGRFFTDLKFCEGRPISSRLYFSSNTKHLQLVARCANKYVNAWCAACGIRTCNWPAPTSLTLPVTRATLIPTKLPDIALERLKDSYHYGNGNQAPSVSLTETEVRTEGQRQLVSWPDANP